jgi:hypothetical protein
MKIIFIKTAVLLKEPVKSLCCFLRVAGFLERVLHIIIRTIYNLLVRFVLVIEDG